MGRHRKTKTDNGLPPYVYLRKGRYVHIPYLGREGGKTKFGKEVRLCAGDAPKSKVWEAYEAIVKNNPTDTLRWLLQQFLASEKFSILAAATKKKYTSAATTIAATTTKDGRPFGDAQFSAITPGTVRKYLDRRAQEGAAVAGNRERATLSAAFSWAFQRDILPKGMANPCHGVERNPERHRERYVTDDEYQYIYDLAATRTTTPWYIRPMMEMAYLCRMRRCEILASTTADILDDGFDTRRAKGSRDAITTWSPRLRAAVDTARNRSRVVTPLRAQTATPLFANDYGESIKEEAFTSAWGRLMRAAQAAAKKEKKEFLSFTFHDLKAKGVSDFDGDKKRASGHRSDAMVQVYDRVKDRVEPTR